MRRFNRFEEINAIYQLVAAEVLKPHSCNPQCPCWNIRKLPMISKAVSQLAAEQETAKCAAQKRGDARGPQC
jgi:hypothetical protein